MGVLSALAVTVLLFLFLVLFVPFRVSFLGVLDERTRGTVSVSWLWGFLGLSVALHTRTLSARAAGKTVLTRQFRGGGKKERFPGPAARTRGKRRRGHPSFPGFSPLRALLRTGIRILRSLDPRGALSICIGLEDPADTGFAFGLASAALSLLRAPVSLSPDFLRRRLSVEGWLELRIAIHLIAASLLGLAVSPDGRKLFRSLRD